MTDSPPPKQERCEEIVEVGPGNPGQRHRLRCLLPMHSGPCSFPFQPPAPVPTPKPCPKCGKPPSDDCEMRREEYGNTPMPCLPPSQPQADWAQEAKRVAALIRGYCWCESCTATNEHVLATEFQAVYQRGVDSKPTDKP